MLTQTPLVLVICNYTTVLPPHVKCATIHDPQPNSQY